MSALDTKEQWQAADDALDRWRAGRAPEVFGHALGVDPGGLSAWIAADAARVASAFLDADDADAEEAQILIAALGMQKFIGVELGLWLASTPEGRAFLEARDE